MGSATVSGLTCVLFGARREKYGWRVLGRAVYWKMLVGTSPPYLLLLHRRDV